MQVEKNALLVKPARRFVAPARPAFPGRRWKQAPRATLVVLRSGLPGQAVPAIHGRSLIALRSDLLGRAVPAVPGATPSHLETPARPSLAGR